MAVRFKADGTIGRAAIYEASDDAPWANPKSYLSRVHFHSDLDYIALSSATPIKDTTVTCSSAVGAYSITHNLGGHGKAGIPFVFGRCQVGGQWLPLTGTVPVVRFVTQEDSNLICFSLAVDATNIYIAESRSFNSSGTFTSVAIPVQVYASEVFA